MQLAVRMWESKGEAEWIRKSESEAEWIRKSNIRKSEGEALPTTSSLCNQFEFLV